MGEGGEWLLGPAGGDAGRAAAREEAGGGQPADRVEYRGDDHAARGDHGRQHHSVGGPRAVQSRGEDAELGRGRPAQGGRAESEGTGVPAGGGERAEWARRAAVRRRVVDGGAVGVRSDGSVYLRTEHWQDHCAACGWRLRTCVECAVAGGGWVL